MTCKTPFVISLIISSILISEPLFAARLALHWTNATTRVDGSVFDPETELASVEIGCGASLTGPFDVFTDSVPNQSGLAAPTQFVTESAPPGLAGCVALSVDTNGVVSAPSNVGAVTYLSPIEAIQDLGQRCYGTCSGTVNFSFTITAP